MGNSSEKQEKSSSVSPTATALGASVVVKAIGERSKAGSSLCLQVFPLE